MTNDRERAIELRGALMRYGGHVGGCPATRSGTCTCGFSDALRPIEPDKE